MKKLISIITVYTLLVVFTFCLGAEYISAESAQSEPLMLGLEYSIETQSPWTAFVLGGDSVVISETSHGYRFEPDSDGAVTGLSCFTLCAAASGESVIRFMGTQEVLILASVSENMVLSVKDVTDSGPLSGVVTHVNAVERLVTFYSETHGEVTAVLPDEMALPVEDELIRVYTNGVMTNSLPPRVNVIAWEAIPLPEQREDE